MDNDRDARYYGASWKWHSAEHDDGRNNGSVLSESFPGHAYAVCKAPQYMPKEDWEKVAPLLAAAPELLEALEEFLKAYDSDKLFGDDPSEVDKARAAIRKAKGEQS